MSRQRQVVFTAVVLLIEVLLGTLKVDPWVLSTAIVLGLLFLLWTWEAMPHVGAPLRLRLTDLTGKPRELQTIQGQTTLEAGRRFTVRMVSSKLNRPLNPECVRYDWHPKEAVSARLLEDGLHFVRRTTSTEMPIYIDWELIEYDRKIHHPFALQFLKSERNHEANNSPSDHT